MEDSFNQCKNCSVTLNDRARFCANCGAKVVNRITLKNMISEFSENVLGWDNKYFITLKLMILKPQLVLGEYVQGVRKKYVHPFSFLIIGVTLMLLALNLFLKDYIESSNRLNIEIVEWAGENIGGPYADKEFQNAQLKGSEESQQILLKYFNILTLIFIPLYALIAFIVYRKPYNYGEHLIINCYIQGTTFIATFIFFLLSVFINPLIYYLTTLFIIFYYMYSYGKLYRLSFADSILKLLLFVVVSTIFTLIGALLIAGMTYLFGKLGYSIF